MKETRFINRGDLIRVLEIEKNSFVNPWTEGEYLECLRSKDYIGMVIEENGEVIGVIVYTLYKMFVEVKRLVICPFRRRDGCGKKLLSKLQQKVKNNPDRKYIYLNVDEYSVDLQLFLRSQGFTCDSNYRFKWECSNKSEKIL